MNNSEYVIHVRSSKQPLNHELILKKVHRVIKFGQKRLVKILHWNEYRTKTKSKK